MRNFEGALDLRLGLACQTRNESHLHTALQDVELAEVLTIVAFRTVQLDQAVSDRAYTIANHTLARLHETVECVMLAESRVVGMQHILLHQDVGVEPFCAVAQSLSYFIEPKHFRFMSADHEAEHQREAGRIAFSIENFCQESKELLLLILLLLGRPLVNLSFLEGGRDVDHLLLEHLRHKNECLIEDLF